MSLSKPSFRFSIVLRVRFADVDALGHVNNAKYLTYFEEARMGYLLGLSHVQSNDLSTLNLILAHAAVTFRAPVRVGDTLEVFAGVTHIGNKSFRMDYTMIQAGTDTLVCDGHTIQVMFDYQNNRTVPVPEQLRQSITEFEEGRLADHTK